MTQPIKYNETEELLKELRQAREELENTMRQIRGDE